MIKRMFLIILILALAGFSLPGDLLIKTTDPSNIKGEIIKKIAEDVYLIRPPEGSRAVSYLLFEENLIVAPDTPLKALATPNDTCTSLRWDLSFIRAFDAWNTATGSDTIYIGLPDTGVDYKHPDLELNLYKNTADCDYDGVDDDGNGYKDDCYGVNVLCYPDGTYNPSASGCNAPDALDDNGHGTHIAGIIGAVGNNGTLIPGINWRVKIIPCKFLNASGDGTVAGEIECLEYFKTLARTKGITIVAVNASYGGGTYNEVEKQVISSLGDIGALYISAAGNSSLNNDEVDFFPCNYDLPNQICVGAADRDGNLASFSHYGFRKVKILAPGVDIKSLRPKNYTNDCSGSLVGASGTSISAPFVSGAVALIKSANPSMSYAKIRERILTSAVQSKSLRGKVNTCGYLDLYYSLNPDNNPKVCLSHDIVDFGTKYYCGHFSLKLVVKNVGNIPVTPLWIDILGGAFYLDQDNCSGITLGSLEECSITITFDPPSAGDFTGFVSLTFLESGLDTTVALRGRLSAELGEGICHQNTGCAGEFLFLFSGLGIVVAFSIVRRNGLRLYK